MKKTFTEVIRNIKKGETWIGKYYKIYLKKDGTLCIYFNKTSEPCVGFVIKENDTFTLKKNLILQMFINFINKVKK